MGGFSRQQFSAELEIRNIFSVGLALCLHIDIVMWASLGKELWKIFLPQRRAGVLHSEKEKAWR